MEKLAAAAGLGVVVVSGGATRAESVAAALALVETELVVIHDAARPLVSAATVDAVLARLRRSPGVDGVIAATPVTDTIKRVEGQTIVATEDRSALWAAQTPQAFRVAALRQAHAAAGMRRPRHGRGEPDRAGGRHGRRRVVRRDEPEGHDAGGPATGRGPARLAASAAEPRGPPAQSRSGRRRGRCRGSRRRTERRCRSPRRMRHERRDVDQGSAHRESVRELPYAYISRVLTDYHVHLREDDDHAPRGRGGVHSSQRRAVPGGRIGGRNRRAWRVGAHPPVSPGTRPLDASRLGGERSRRPPGLLRVRALDTDSPRHRDGLRPRGRGPHRRAARPLRLRLRDRLGALRRRPRRGRRRVRHLAERPKRG